MVLSDISGNNAAIMLLLYPRFELNSRITVLSPNIKTKPEVAVDQRYKNISQFVDDNIPIVPDGSLELQDGNNSTICYLMDFGIAELHLSHRQRRQTREEIVHRRDGLLYPG
ncbi:MAG TPA: hypothetical protein DIT99_06230 [Candidatus Latescibacteria bacterium]|nr:hypothetical protein [Candidatus Latescibacterota bacterium]